MRRTLITGLIVIAAAVALIAGIAITQERGEAARGPLLVAAFGVGQVQGERAFVHVVAIVPEGRDPAAVAEEAVRAQGARPATPRDFDSAEFATTGLVWDQFGDDGDAGNDFVTQYYNQAGDQTGITDGGKNALLNTHATWTEVSNSSFTFAYGGETDRCPSLVRECPGDQTFDGFNDVAWVDLGRCSPARCTLGVTWYSTSIDEADMALTTSIGWTHDCNRGSGAPYDAETVYLHENGHVGGLGHSEVTAAVMYAYYGSGHCDLHQDDIDGIRFLYPEDGGEPAPTATPTATPEATPTPTATAEPPPPGSGMHVADLDGLSINQGSTWRASVTVTAHDAGHNALSGVTVHFTWSGGFAGSATCTTNGSGQCTAETGNVPKRNGSVTFTVDDLTDSLTYSPADNHDPDGDSDGTQIVVNKP